MRFNINSIMLARRTTYCGASDVTPDVLGEVAALTGHDVAFYAGAKAIAEEQLGSPAVPLPRFEYNSTFKGTGRTGSATAECRGTLPPSAIPTADDTEVQLPMAFRIGGSSNSSPPWYVISGGALFAVVLCALVVAACVLWFGRGFEGPEDEDMPLGKGEEEGEEE